MARTAAFATELGRHLPTTPAVVWRVVEDFDRWADWLALSPPATVAVDFSTLKRGADWSWGRACLEALADRLTDRGVEPRLLVVGPGTTRRLRELAKTWPHPPNAAQPTTLA